MKIEFLEEYKSTRKDIYDLPDFTVLTGENGSGKSNFLDGIYNGKDNVEIDGVPRASLEIKHFNYNSFDSSHRNDYSTRHYANSSTNRMWQRLEAFRRGEAKLSEHDEKYIKELAEASGKDFSEITEEDFKKTRFSWIQERIQLFGFNFYEHIADYLSHYEENRYNRFLNETYGENNLLYSQEEFTQKFGNPPWETMNDLLEEADLNYRVVVPPQSVRNQNIKPLIIDNILGKELRLDDMSSGEKMILALISFLYNLEVIKNVPDLFLFDEPDALLHPFYSKMFIEILKSNIVDRLKKKVILVTHSPSTVAIVPEESIWLCKKEGFKIEKVSKDEALNNLTSNINSLSILHENRRQVFVEDKDDAKIYEAVKNKIIKHLIPEISLNFIPVSLSESAGCSAVKNIVKALNDGGNNLVFGIIDWDLKNNPSDKSNVLVMGHQVRYSIENYLLDPVFLAAYLLKEKIIEREDLSLFNNENYTDFKLLESPQLQIIADFIIEKAIEKKPQNVNEDLLIVTYLNGKTVSIPKWFFELNGHNLEKFFLEKFKSLKPSKMKLSLRVLRHIVDDIPELIPIDFKEVFLEIQRV